MNYYVDIYTSGSPSDIRGPFADLEDARALAQGEQSTVQRIIAVDVKPYDSTVEHLDAVGDVALVEAWAETDDSEDYSAIYSVA